MYAVFVRVLKTDKGKAIVQKYKGIFDAQRIYQELQEYASKSTQAIIDAKLFSSISPLPVLVMVPGMVQPDNLFSIGWNKSNCTKNLLTSPPHCQTP